MDYLFSPRKCRNTFKKWGSLLASDFASFVHFDFN
jgi:hypothetical protein